MARLIISDGKTGEFHLQILILRAKFITFNKGSHIQKKAHP